MNDRRWLAAIFLGIGLLWAGQASAVPYFPCLPCPCDLEALVGALPGEPPLQSEVPLAEPLLPAMPSACPAPAACPPLALPACPPAVPCPLPPPPPVVVPCRADPPAPLVKLKVRVPACAPEGKELVYRIGVENCSPGAAHHVIVRNPLPANAKFVQANPAPTQTGKELAWKLGTMHGGEVRIIELVLAPTDSNDVHNCTRVQYEHGQCVTTRQARAMPGVFPPETVPPEKAPPEKGPPEKRPPEITEGTAKLTLSMDGPKQHAIKDTADYLITVANVGKAAATNVLVSTTVPDKMKFVRADQGGKLVDRQVAWLLGTLQPGASRTIELFVQANAAGEICLKAKALADKGLSAEAEFCTTFGGASALGLEMIDRRDPIKLGDDNSYTILVINQGKVPITNVRIRALLPEGLVLTRATGPADPAKEPGPKTPEGYHPLDFQPLPSLAPGASVQYEVFVAAVQVGDLRFKVEMTADQLPNGPVFETESTHVYPEDAAGGAQPPLMGRRQDD